MLNAFIFSRKESVPLGTMGDDSMIAEAIAPSISWTSLDVYTQ